MRRFALALLLIPVLAVGQSWPLLYITASQTGVSAAALSGGVTTSAIPMGSPSSSVPYNQLTLSWSATVGSSTTMTVTCTGSVDGGSNYRAIERCADGSTYTCTAATWSYDLTTQTAGLINIPSNYSHIKCTFTATGTGTVTGAKGVV